jgi:hypothetical protein
MSTNKSNCSGWTATHDFMPPGPAHLTVRGKCTFPTPGYAVSLKKKTPQGINPSILILDKSVTSPSGPEPDIVTASVVTYDEVTSQRYTEVQLSDGTKIEVRNIV